MDRWRLDRWRKDRTIRGSLAVPSGMQAGRGGESAAPVLAGWPSTVKEVAGHELEANVTMKWQGPGPSNNISLEECVRRRKQVRSQNK